MNWFFALLIIGQFFASRHEISLVCDLPPKYEGKPEDYEKFLKSLNYGTVGITAIGFLISLFYIDTGLVIGLIGFFGWIVVYFRTMADNYE